MENRPLCALSRRALLRAAPAAALGIAWPFRARCAPANTVVTLTIESDGDFLGFKPDQLTCRSGDAVRLIFHHTGQIISQDHDWVLVFPGKVEDVAKAGEAAGETSGFVPKNDARVIAATPLCGKGGTVMAEFTAPPPGDYPFFCSNPGHSDDMRGILHVTA